MDMLLGEMPMDVGLAWVLVTLCSLFLLLSLAKTSSVFPGKGLGQLRRGPLSG